MIESKKINIIIAIAVIFALITSIALVIVGNIQKLEEKIKTEAEYETKIFGMDIISLEIIADEKDWQGMLENAINEQYIMADVVVNGNKFQNVGVRPKGNSSLTQVANSDSDRYSFRLQFDEYIKDQTCFGLESFVINNMIGDNTYMKEYVSYELMDEIGVDAPLFGYADIKVNGKNWGLYLAVELYNESFEQRTFGDTSGMLYNVKSMDMGGFNQGEQGGNIQAMPDGQNSRPQRANDSSKLGTGVQQNSKDNIEGQPSLPPSNNGRSDTNLPPNIDNNMIPEQMDGETSGMDRTFEGKGGRSNSGGSLEYIDDNTEKYSAIFNNVVGKGTESDFQRVVQALKVLSEGKKLETYFDVDQILRYLAAHTIVVNLDSYSSSMAQNYYIYENEGRITILPWDYNLAWGGFQSGNASSVINFPIDTPVSGIEMSSTPLIEKLFANTEYLERYHSYLELLIDNYFVDGKFEKKIEMFDALISDYVKNDTTAFCTYEEYKTAVATFITLGNLRAESVQGQLDGNVPSTTVEQNTKVEHLIAAGDLKLSDLGSMMGGKGGDKDDFPIAMNNGLDKELMSKSIDIIQKANGEITDQVKEALLSLGLTSEQIEQLSSMNDGNFGGRVQNNEQRNPTDNNSRLNFSEEQESSKNNLILIGVLSIVLAGAILFASKFKNRY